MKAKYTIFFVFILFALAARQEDKLEFKWESVPLKEVLDYVQRNTGHTFVNEANIDIKKKVKAYSEQGIPKSAIIEFVRTILRQLDATCEEFDKKIIVIMKYNDAKAKTMRIFVGNEPDKVPLTNEVRVQIIQVQYLEVKQIDSNLSNFGVKGIDVRPEETNNLLIVTGPAVDIHKYLKILREVDIPPLKSLSWEIIELKNADAEDLAETLRDAFKSDKKDSKKPDYYNPPKDKKVTLASETVRIVANDRTNSILVVATKENVAIIKELALRLDTMSKTSGVNIASYPLRYADANEVAEIINKMFQREKANDPTKPAKPKTRSNSSNRDYHYSTTQDDVPDGDKQPKKSSTLVKAMAYPRTNTVIIMASDTYQKVIAKLIEDMDTEVREALDFKTYAIQYGVAKDVGKQIEDLFKNTQSGTTPQQGQLLKEVKVSVDERTNAITVRAPKFYIEKIDKLVASLDIKPNNDEIMTIKLKNSDPKKLAALIDALLKGTSPSNPNTTPTNPNNNTNMNPTTNTNPTIDPPNKLGPLPDTNDQDKPPDKGGVHGKVDLQPDPDSGNLIIKTSKSNMEAIKKLIEELDKFKPHVVIKVLIMEVSLEDNLQFGVQGFWENKLHLPNKDLGTMKFDNTFNNMPQKGFTYLLKGDELEATLKALGTETKLNVLATPRVLAINNQQAEIFVGQKVPVVNGFTQTNLGPVPTTEYRDVGILLRVTPTINPDGMVTLQVTTGIADVAPVQGITIVQNITLPVFNDNRASTTATLKNGQTVVIGGLIRDSDSINKEKIPILGDIPGLGLLFSTEKKQKQKRELVLFLTPNIVYSPGELEELTELEKSKLKLIDPKLIESEAPKWRSKIKN